MTTIDFWFDPVSPYAFLAFERLPEALAGLSYEVRYRPIVFGALLAHHAHKGPAEIEPKRAWAFRQVHWQAAQLGIVLKTPARHPFNSLALSRLIWACAPEGATPGRYACERVLRHAWQSEGGAAGEGADAEDADRLASLGASLAPPLAIDDPAVKQRLRAATDDAIARGVFGVPTVGVGERLFWGLDALPMVAGQLRGDPWFAGGAWDRAGAPRAGVRRDRMPAERLPK